MRNKSRILILCFLATLLVSLFPSIFSETISFVGNSYVVGPISSPNTSNSFEGDITHIGDYIHLEGEKITIILKISEKGYISRITNRETSQTVNITENISHLAWLIEFIDGSWYSSDNSYSFSYSINGLLLKCRYEFLKLGDPVYVDIIYQIDSPHPGINAKIDVSSNYNISGVRRTFFPYITGIESWAAIEGMEQLAVSEREGWLFTDPINTFKTEYYGSTYPGTMSMQFMVLTEPEIGGFVISAQDPNSNFKGIEIQPHESKIKLDWYHYGAYEIYNSWSNQSMNYWMVFNGYSGNSWADGADQYKEWALKQWYVQKGPVINREDIPEWLKTLDYAWKSGSYATHSGIVTLEGDTVDKMGYYRDSFVSRELSDNFILDWWGWQQGGHDNDYPEYFPPRDGHDKLLTGISNAHTKGTKVKLYLNGRLVDVDTQTYLDHQDDLTGIHSSIYQESYGPYFTAAIADPASDWWQELMLNITLECVGTYGADMVYLDQISVAPPKFDYRSGVDHTLGGGSWWQEAENELLANIQNNLTIVNPESGIASENVIETYLNTVDLFWTYPTSYQLNRWFPQGIAIPLFNYIYNEYVLCNGRGDIRASDPPTFKWAISEMLSGGYLPGGPGALADINGLSSTSLKILKNSYLTRKLGNFQFFRDGELLGPIQWKTSPDITVGAQGIPFDIPQGIIQGYRGTGKNIAYLFGNRGTSNLIWSGFFSDLLGENSLVLSNLTTEKLMIFRNGELESIQNPSDSLKITLQENDFILVWLGDAPIRKIPGYNLITIAFLCGIIMYLVRNRFKGIKIFFSKS